MRRRAIACAGGFENAFRGMFEDQVFFYKLFATLGVWIDAACLERYRQHPDSWCHRMRELGEWTAASCRAQCGAEFLEWLGAYPRANPSRPRSSSQSGDARNWPFTSPLLYRASRLARRLRGDSLIPRGEKD